MSKLSVQCLGRGYAPRTYYNAQNADVTVAFAVDFTTAGERLTEKAALNGGHTFCPIPLLELEPHEAARKVYRVMPKEGMLNIAGNGLYTLDKHLIEQKDINLFVYNTLAKVHQYKRIGLIRSGGQTGADLAGAIAGYMLGIDVQITMPEGFLQRHNTGLDCEANAEQISEQVYKGAEELRKHTANEVLSRLRWLMHHRLSPLPGTETEIRNILAQGIERREIANG